MVYSLCNECAENYCNRTVLVDAIVEDEVACLFQTHAVAVLRWGQGGTGPQILPSLPQFLDTVVLLLVELIGSIVNFA